MPCPRMHAKTCKCIEAAAMSQTELTTDSPMRQVRRHKDKNKANRKGSHRGGKGWDALLFLLLHSGTYEVEY